MSARDELRDCFLSDSRDRFDAAADAHREEVIAKAIGRLRAVPVQCTALTGPVWYGQGWADAITTLEEIAEYSVPDYEAYPGELEKLRALALQLRATAREENWDRVGQLIQGHAASDRLARAAVTEKASAPAPTATPQPVLTNHQQRLLAHIRRDTTPTVWSTGPVERLYLTWRVRTARHEARRDLAQLAHLGYLTARGDDTGRRYTLKTKDGGQ